MGKLHYIGMSGQHGYLPQYTILTESVKEAVDDLSSLHELSRRQRKELRQDRTTELTPDQGAEYAEIVECYCDTPEDHEE